MLGIAELVVFVDNGRMQGIRMYEHILYVRVASNDVNGVHGSISASIR